MTLERMDYVDSKVDYLVKKYKVREVEIDSLMTHMVRKYKLDMVKVVDMLVTGCEETLELEKMSDRW